MKNIIRTLLIITFILSNTQAHSSLLQRPNHFLTLSRIVTQHSNRNQNARTLLSTTTRSPLLARYVRFTATGSAASQNNQNRQWHWASGYPKNEKDSTALEAYASIMVKQGEILLKRVCLNKRNMLLNTTRKNELINYSVAQPQKRFFSTCSQKQQTNSTNSLDNTSTAHKKDTDPLVTLASAEFLQELLEANGFEHFAKNTNIHTILGEKTCCPLAITEAVSVAIADYSMLCIHSPSIVALLLIQQPKLIRILASHPNHKTESLIMDNLYEHGIFKKQ